MQKFTIRQFQASDALEVYDMLESTEELHVCGFTYSQKAVRNWHVTRAEDIILIVEVEGEVVGFISSKLNDPEPGSAYIDCIAVKPNYRGRKIGQKLLNQCISLLKARGVFFVALEVKSNFPRSINFWEKNNFKGKQNMLWLYKEI